MRTEFRADMFGEVKVGQAFVISGISHVNFKINFKNRKYTTDTENDHIPLHLSIKFNGDYIIRNSKPSGDSAWGEEEKQQNCLSSIRNPIVKGELFKIFILVCNERFNIAINDKLYCTYEHRLRLNCIHALVITTSDGDFQSMLQFDHRTVYPTLYPPIQHQTIDKTLQFSCDIPEKLKIGHVTVITATPYGNPCGSFSIYITEGATQKQALHFNALFHPHFVVLRNAMDDKFGFPCEHNETSGTFPFTINRKFKLAICYTNTEFKFAVNGAVFGSFKYRSSNLPDNLNGLKVSGLCELYLKVTGVDYIKAGPANGDGFEKHSRFASYDN